MFRRSRFSIRPNVGTAGRTAATPQEAPVASQEASETPSDVSESTGGPLVTPSEKNTASGDGSEQIGEGSSSSAAVQRRKRFSVKPKVAPGRPATLARTPKSPVKPVSEPPVEAPGSDFDKPTTSSQCGPTAASQGLGSPKRRRPSGDVKQAKVQPKPTLMPSESSANSTEDSLKQTRLPADIGKQLQSTSGNQVKEAPPRVPTFIPDKEAIELSEKAKTLVSSKSRLSLSPSALSLSRLLNDPSDLQRLAKAQKLRELLREERHKEKRLKKAKSRVKEYTLDPAKMTMRDLIHYVPLSNPMMSSVEHSAEENETVVPTLPGGEDRSPETAQQPEIPIKIMSPREEENEEVDEDQEEALMVPQVKVAEDGSLIIDEESLTVEVQRAKGPNPAQDRDPIFERGSTTTYSSFRKGICSKPWSSEETDMFFLAISMVGTDFSMICQLFPHRARAEIKNKFKKEERENTWRIDKAFRERRKLDIEYFSKLLEKILEFQKNRKKLKSLAQKNSSKKQRKRKAKGKKAARKLSDVEEELEEEEDPPDLEEGEKENELCNEGETTSSKPKEQRKRNAGKDDSNMEPSNKKNKTGERSSEQGEHSIPEDTKAALPEDPKASDTSEQAENADAKDTAVKPAKPSRGRAPKAPLPLGWKWGNKGPPPSTKEKDSGDESVSDGATNQVNKDASPSRFSADNENSSDEEVVAVPPPRPTRYGRVPKPTKHLTYLCKENEHSSASETTPSSPVQHIASAAKPKPKCTAKRGRPSAPQSDHESKKPKLVTLRASQSDYSDEENEQEETEEEVNPACSPSKDSAAPAFVPASLRSPHSKISMVEETMEELDILANMPDVLGISQDALCPDASCEQAQNETGITEPCEHQLDLLVDVIDFLSSEQTEVSEDESYNEAAQTLLTIGNLTHLFQVPQNQIATQDHIPGTTSNNETSQLLESEIPSDPAAHEQTATHCETAASCFAVTENTGAVASMELQTRTGDSGDFDQIINEQWTNSDVNCTSQLQSSPESLKKKYTQTESVLKPDLSQCSTTVQMKFHSETSTIIGSVTESAPEETPECSPLSVKDISLTEIKLTEELSCSHERSDSKIESGAVNQSQCSSDGQVEPSVEHTNKETGIVSHAKITESGSILAASKMSVTELHFEQGSNTDSVPGQEGCDQSASVASLVEDLPVSEKAENEVVSTSQPRRSQLQKVRPKPNLPQTCRAARSKPQVTKNSEEKACRPTPIPKTTAEVEEEQSCATPPEKPIESTDPVSDLEPSSDLGATLKSTEELSAEEKNTHDGLQIDAGSAASGGSSSENKSLSEDNFHPSIEQTRTLSMSESTDEKLMSHAEIIKSGSNLAVSEISVTEPQVKQDSVPVQEGSHCGAGSVKPAEDVSQNAESRVALSCQSRRSRLQRVKPNLPQLQRTAQSKPQTSKDSKEKDLSTSLDVEPEQTCVIPAETTQSTVPASDLMFSLDLASVLIPTEEISTTEVKNTHGVSGHVDSSEAISGQCVSEKLSLPKVQVQFHPSGEQASRVTTTHLASRTEYTDNIIADVDVQPTCSTIDPKKSSQSSGAASVSVLPLETCTNDKPREEQKSSDGFGLDSSFESSESNIPQRKWRSLKVKPKPNLASSARTTRPKLHPKGIVNISEQCHLPREQQSACKNESQAEPEPSDKDTKNLTSVHSSLSTDVLDSSKSTAADMKISLVGTRDKGISSTRSNMSSILTANADSTPDLKERGPQSIQKSDTEDNSQDTAQQCFETSEVSQTSNKSQSPHSTDGSQSAGYFTSLKKTLSPHRGRLIIPRANQQHSSQLSKVQSTTQEKADSGTCSKEFQKSVSELRPYKEPVEGAAEQHKNLDCRPDCAVGQLDRPDTSSHDSEPSLGCLTQVPSTQSVSTLTSEGTQSHPCVTLFSDMLSEQVPSDPDEPFFILSLTEIPVCSSGEVVDSVAEPLSYLPVTDASIPQQSSLPGESLEAAAGGASLSDAPVLMSEEQSGEMHLINVNRTGLDQTTCEQDLIMKTPVDEHVHSSEAVENKNDGEIPPTKQSLRGTGRGDKMHVKPTRTRTKQASKTLATNTIQDPSQLESSVQPEACDANASDEVVTEPQKGSGDQVDIHKETLTCGKGSSLGAPTQITKTRKPKDSIASSSVPAPGNPVSTSSKVKTPHSPGKPSSTPPHNAAPTPGPTKSPDKAYSTLSTTSPTQMEMDVEQNAEHNGQCSDPASGTSQGTAEVSASQQSDDVLSSLMEEEPTNVSQYFLSDIFTDVEEG